MPITINCRCGRTLNLRDELAGKLIACPGCKASVRVPAFDVVEEVVAGPPTLKLVPKPAASVRESPVARASGPPPLPKLAAKAPPSTPDTRPKVAPTPMPVTEFVDEPVEHPAPRTPALPPPLPIRLQEGPAPDIAAGPPPPAPKFEENPEEEIPEFEDLEILGDETGEDHGAKSAVSAATQRPTNAQDDWDNWQLDGAGPAGDADDWEAAWLQGPTSEGAAASIAANFDDGDDWENAHLTEDSTIAARDAKATAQEEPDDVTPYQLGANVDARRTLDPVGPIAEIGLDTDYITCLAYGADHKTHLAANGDEVFCLDFSQHADTLLPRMHSASVECLGLSPCCRLALSGDADGGLMLWDLAQQKALRWLDGHRGVVTAVAFSPDGVHAASGSTGGAVWLWNVTTGQRMAIQQGQLDDSVSSVCFSPDGDRLLALGSRGRTRLWNVSDRTTMLELEAGAAQLHTATFSKDGAFILASSSRRLKVCKWDAQTGERMPAFMNAAQRESRVRCSWVGPGGGSLLAVGLRLKPAHRHEVDHASANFPLYAGVFGLGVWAARDTVAGFANDITDLMPKKPMYYLELWDIVNERPVSSVPLGLKMPPAIAGAADGHRAIVGFHDGCVLLFGL